MKTKRVIAVLAILLLLTGCTVTEAVEETPSPTFSSAGKEVITGTKKAAERMQEEVAKAVEKASEKLTEQDQLQLEVQPEKKPQAESNPNPELVKQSVPEKTPKSDPVLEIQTTSEEKSAPEPKPDPKPEPAPQPTPEPDPVPTPEPTPSPTPPQACPGGKDPSLGCEVILDTNYYRETFSSYAEAMARGQYYMDEVMYIGDIEITSYSVQEVYRNDHSVAYYGLNLWSNGSLIQ